MPLKLFIRQIISLLYYGCFIHLLQNHGRILILMYHRILPDNEINDLLIQPGMYVTEKTFNKQLNFPISLKPQKTLGNLSFCN